MDEAADKDVVGHDVPAGHGAEDGGGGVGVAGLRVGVEEVVGEVLVGCGAGGEEEGVEAAGGGQGGDGGLEEVGEEGGVRPDVAMVGREGRRKAASAA